MDYFGWLGARIEAAWRRREHDEAALADVALEALTERPPHLEVSGVSAARWLLERQALPRQLDPQLAFGQPPITVYATDRFYIDLYFWRDSSPSVHDHPFAGVFAVIEGCSLHAVYDFHETRRVNDRVRLGHLQLSRCELVRPGECRIFPPDRPLTHRLLHTDLPSLSMVVRTRYSVRPVYFNHHPPALAIDALGAPGAAVAARKRGVLGHLREIGAPEHDELLGAYLATADLEEAFLLLDELYVASDRLEELEPHLATARAALGPPADALRPVFAEKLRVAQLESMRREVSSEPARFILSLLMIAPPRRRLFELIEERYPETPSGELALETLRELSRVDGGPALAPEYAALDLGPAALERMARALEGDGDGGVPGGAGELFAPLFEAS